MTGKLHTGMLVYAATRFTKHEAIRRYDALVTPIAVSSGDVEGTCRLALRGVRVGRLVRTDIKVVATEEHVLNENSVAETALRYHHSRFAGLQRGRFSHVCNNTDSIF